MPDFKIPPLLTAATGLLLCALAPTRAPAQFPFPIGPGTPITGLADFSDLNHEPAGAHGFVRRDGEHFVTDKGKIRFWGVNLCFGANFPSAEDAEKIAAHLASLAINGVRIHHQETQYSPSGLYDKETKKLDPAQIEKLDYLLAQLHARGIYANINLHVGRNVAREMGLPALGGGGHSATGDKHLLHFFPPVQEAFWQYCRDYLGHTNPHRKLRRADDPGVAMIEILNENRFHKDGPRYLINAPEPYRTEILKQWNAWLKKTYATDDALRAAWTKDAPPRGEPLIKSPTHPLADGWAFNDNGGKSPVTLTSPDNGTLRITPQGAAEQSWHRQLYRPDISVAKGQTYTLTFDARADTPRRMQFSLATMEGGWKSLGLSSQAELTNDWQSFTFRFVAAETSAVGKFAFDIGDAEAPVELRALDLFSGTGGTVLPDDQSIADASVLIPDGAWVPAANTAFIDFMADTERAFYRKTRALLKELGVRVPVATTQVNYQGAAMAAELGDYTDIHSYWHHPLFPGKNWDGDNWTIGHDPLESRPYANQWPRNNPLIRSSWRVHGMPFTYSEWNVGEPSFPSAGAVPIMAMLGSLQDWSGIFFFDYESTNGDPYRDKITTYFSFNAQPAKLALLGPFGQLYRSGALAALTETHAAPSDAHRGSGIHAFTKRVGIDPKLPQPAGHTDPEEPELLKAHPPLLTNPAGSATWDARDPSKAILTINLPTVRALWGQIDGQTVELGDWKFEVGDPPKGYGIIIAQSRDGLPFDKSKRILITSVCHAENQNFPWKNAEKTAGGWDWGKGPAQVWNTPFILTVPKSQTAKTLHALSPTGQPLNKIESAGTTYKLNQPTNTIWFEFTP